MGSNRQGALRWTWIVTIASSLVVGVMVPNGLAIAAIVVGVVVVVTAPARWKVATLVITSQLPVDVGTLGRIPDVLLIEIIAIPVLLLAVVHAIRSGRPLIPRQARAACIFVALFAAVAAAHAYGLLGAAGSMGNSVSAPNTRAYLDLGLAIVVFVAALYWADAEQDWTDAPLILITCLGIVTGLLRLFVYFSGGQMPVLGGRFQYDVVTSVSGVEAARIGGLTEAASFAIGGALGLLQRQRNRALAVVGVVSGLAFAIISGGRSYGVGLVAGFLVYFTVLPNRRAWLRAVAMGIATVVTSVFIAAVGLSAQLTRLSAFAGGIEGQDPYRFEAMGLLWAEFLSNPLFGKGIGAQGEGLAEQFVSDIVSQGGHTTYLSALANFGIFGLAVNVAVLWSAIARAWRTLRRNVLRISPPAYGWLAMTLFILVTKVVEYTVSGNGYSDFAMYAIAGSAIAIQVLSPSDVEAAEKEAGDDA